MKYMLLLYSTDEKRPPRGADTDRWQAVTEEMRTAGVLLDGDALHDTDAATTLRDGTVTDGPFAETKEILGGYYAIDVPDLDAATEWARKLPIAEYGSIEIRPVFDYQLA
ncbi:MAG: hypothetical protein AVDCRST_MAG85-3944 [uncultured Solirubrobacteraceae bacterium]|uniref:YCII-related domain-containing protein n=1 Tax=uncultured Solirubrobacteraceae bacterium TaxID=1162706 RepID=A0A6J4TWM0_9ACTN|nr:MAG: hypothetical protein AVDCRST_MAG85-3944 [uncultured Solirubrobacteraceae bacterium]